MAEPPFLVCTPTYFGVEYVINPWMQGNLGGADNGRARLQWAELVRTLGEELGARLEQVPPVPGQPDMCFTANAGLVRDGIAVPARFRHPERAGEEPAFRRWFEEAGYRTRALPEGMAFEGEGDALFDHSGVLWAAHGFRTDIDAHGAIAERIDCQMRSLRLVDAHFYHLDTCFCPLPGGHCLWYPPAFDPASGDTIRALIPDTHLCAVGADDAAGFACNAVAVGTTLVMNFCSAALSSWLTDRGFLVRIVPLDQFLKAGGAAKCLVLRLG